MSSSTSEVDTTEPTSSTSRGPAIDVVFNIGGGHCQNRRQHPPGGPSSMSYSTSVMDAVRPASSSPRGPALDVFFNLGGGRCRTHR
jgi:hypothetical protein